jgi:hypothetical protein
MGKAETTFKIEELDDLHAIKLRCQQSGYYSRWVLTEAQSSTFAEVEIGIEPARWRALGTVRSDERRAGARGHRSL